MSELGLQSLPGAQEVGSPYLLCRAETVVSEPEDVEAEVKCEKSSDSEWI